MAHEHAMYNSDPHFKIDPDTRELKHTSPEKLTIMQGDHNSEIISFDMPRFIDGHDMALCNRIQVQYINIDTTFTSTYLTGVYEVTDKEITVDDDGNEIIVFSWPVSSNATTYVGPLNFGIRFCCITDSIIEYSWHTAICKRITISKSFNNNEEFIEQYIDVLSEWETRLFGPAGSAIRIGNVTLPASKWEGEESPYSQVVTIEGATENTQVDLTPDVQQLSIFHHKDLAFVTENEDGVVTVYAIGQKPENDYTIQVTMMEVIA